VQMQEKYTIFNYKNKRYLIKPSIKVEVEYNKDLWQYFIPVYNILTYGKTKKEVEEKAWEEFYTLYHNKKLGYFIKEMKKDDKLNEELLFIINETREETEWRIIWRHLKFVEDKLKSNDMKIYSAFYGQVFYFNMEQKDFIKKLLFIIESIYSIYFTIFWGNRPPITGSFPAFGIVGPSSDIGLSTCITNDKWTDKDSLGYDIYAHAIYKFIIHEDTKAPFTISIQAPWGGGKTSLMRMLQKLLDPKALKDKTEEVSTNKLTVKDLYKELRLLNAEEKLNSWWSAIKRFINYPNEKSNYLKDNLEGTKLTVWLNVWKYENTQQIWAGLADAIVRQISERMDTVEREKFLFYLKYKRLDVNKIRDKIHNAIF